MDIVKPPLASPLIIHIHCNANYHPPRRRHKHHPGRIAAPGGHLSNRCTVRTRISGHKLTQPPLLRCLMYVKISTARSYSCFALPSWSLLARPNMLAHFFLRPLSVSFACTSLPVTISLENFPLNSVFVKGLKVLHPLDKTLSQPHLLKGTTKCVLPPTQTHMCAHFHRLQLLQYSCVPFSRGRGAGWRHR